MGVQVGVGVTSQLFWVNTKECDCRLYRMNVFSFLRDLRTDIFTQLVCKYHSWRGGGGGTEKFRLGGDEFSWWMAFEDSLG